VVGIALVSSQQEIPLPDRALPVTCFDIGGSFIRYGQLQTDGMVPELGRVATPREDFAAFVTALRAAVQQTGAKAISISIAGAFDTRSGIADVANIPCLTGRRVVDDLTDHLGLPVLLTNDADCFALAEAHLGAGRGADVVFGIIIGSGVGGGVVVNGHLLRAHGGISGEWGHGPVLDATLGGLREAPAALVCGCGLTGCVDATCSARGMEKLHLASHGQALDSVEITRRWKAGDQAASDTIAIYVRCIAQALSMVVNTLGPQIVPVSGGLASEPELIRLIDTELRGLVLAEYEPGLVVPGVFSADGGLVGAGIAARQGLADFLPI
jgi:N-acetylglucosamine kinase